MASAPKKITELDPRGIVNDGDQMAVVVNTTGATKKASLRDVLGSYGMFYFPSSVAIVPASAGVFEKLAGSTTPVGLEGFTHSAGRLTYSGGRKRRFDIKANVSAETLVALPGENIDIRIAVNGITRAQSQVGTISLIPGDQKVIASFDSVELESGDEVEIWFQSDQAALAITFHQVQLLIKAL